MALMLFIIRSMDYPRIGEHRHSCFYEETRSLLPVLYVLPTDVLKGSCQITKCHLMSVLIIPIQKGNSISVSSVHIHRERLSYPSMNPTPSITRKSFSIKLIQSSFLIFILQIVQVTLFLMYVKNPIIDPHEREPSFF